MLIIPLNLDSILLLLHNSKLAYLELPHLQDLPVDPPCLALLESPVKMHHGTSRLVQSVLIFSTLISMFGM